MGNDECIRAMEYEVTCTDTAAREKVEIFLILHDAPLGWYTTDALLIHSPRTCILLLTLVICELRTAAGLKVRGYALCAGSHHLISRRPGWAPSCHALTQRSLALQRSPV